MHVAGPLMGTNRKRIADFALKSRLPSMYTSRELWMPAGSCPTGRTCDSYRRAAIYVDKILKGAKPADLPVEQPTKFEFMINLKAAKADRPDDSAECAGESGQSD